MSKEILEFDLKDRIEKYSVSDYKGWMFGYDRFDELTEDVITNLKNKYGYTKHYIELDADYFSLVLMGRDEGHLSEGS